MAPPNPLPKKKNICINDTPLEVSINAINKFISLHAITFLKEYSTFKKESFSLVEIPSGEHHLRKP